MAGGRVVVGWLVSKVGRAAPWKGRDWSSDWLGAGAGVQVDIHLSGGRSLGRTDRQQELACWASEGVAGASEWGGGRGSQETVAEGTRALAWGLCRTHKGLKFYAEWRGGHAGQQATE